MGRSGDGRADAGGAAVGAGSREVVAIQLNRELQAAAPVYVREFPLLVGGRVPGERDSGEA